MTVEWVAALANVVIAGGVIVGIFQLFAANKQVGLLTEQLKTANAQTKLQATQLQTDHERSRRERAVELIQTWAIQVNRKASSARKLVENLNEEQVRAIWNQEQVRLDKKYAEIVKSCLTESFYLNISEITLGDDDAVKLQDKDSSEIRWLIVSYLNLLESILVAWHNGIADKEMIENQFKYLVSPEKGHFILEKFRQTAGGVNVYPAIDAFVNEIKNKTQAPNGKAQVINA